MKFGVREICNVVLKAKAAQKVGNKIFYKNEPVLYFDTLKTSSMEGAATTVYAQGGRGNARLVAWEGERTVTFTMEDALISPEGFMILSGAGLIEASENKPIYQHIVETTDDIVDNGDGTMTIYLEKRPFLPRDGKENFAYVMLMKNGEAASEPYIPDHVLIKDDNGQYDYDAIAPEEDGAYAGKYRIDIKAHEDFVVGEDAETNYELSENAGDEFANVEAVLVDYYVAKLEGAKQIEITADKFGGNYYLEASTLFRNQDGVDLPAEFIIPNCKIQSNFTFTMASSGDPSTFTFTMDAFPDYTRFDKSKKVLAAIQIIDTAGSMDIHRTQTDHVADHEALFE